MSPNVLVRGIQAKNTIKVKKVKSTMPKCFYLFNSTLGQGKVLGKTGRRERSGHNEIQSQ